MSVTGGIRHAFAATFNLILDDAEATATGSLSRPSSGAPAGRGPPQRAAAICVVLLPSALTRITGRISGRMTVKSHGPAWGGARCGWRAGRVPVRDSGVADVAMEAAFNRREREVHCVRFRGLASECDVFARRGLIV